MPETPELFDEKFILKVIAEEAAKEGYRISDTDGVAFRNICVRVYLRGCQEMQNVYTDIFNKIGGKLHNDKKN